VLVREVIPTKSTFFWKSMGATFASVKETSISEGVNAAITAIPNGGNIAFLGFP
jgi:hypothetical protein